MRYTLLEMTQMILSAMDSDEVTTIAETTESQQVVSVIKTAYGDVATTMNLPRDYNLFALEATSVATPTAMNLPSRALSLEWLKYDVQTTDYPDTTYRKLIPMLLMDFLEMVHSFDPTATNVDEFTINTINGDMTFFAYNDRGPTYYTTLDDGEVIFDSYDSEVDAGGLVAAKTMAWGQLTYPWSETDNFEFPLDDRGNQLLLQKAKALAFAELKQQVHASAEKSVRELKISGLNDKQKVRLQRPIDRAPNYGR